MTGTYDLRLVALSIAIAMAASYTALDLAGRVRMHQASARWFWIAGGGSAMGLGIWAMHYVGMLAFQLPVPVLYHIPTVLLSLLAAILASQAALLTVSQPQLRARQFMIGSLIMGGGISAMHYVGMEAMRLPAIMQYRPKIVVLSIVIAVAIAGVALLLSSRAQNQQKASLQKISSALLMGLAIPAMHYTAMRAAVFIPKGGTFDSGHAIHISLLGVIAITGASLLVLALVVSAAFVDRLLAAEKAINAAVQTGETNFRNLTEAIPQMIWIARPDAHVEFFNRRWFEYTGLNSEQSQGLMWETIVHPDDLSACLYKWRQSQRTGEAYQVEYRLRRADGSYRWHLGRALAVRDETQQVTRWLGSCTDIDDQKKTERALEQQVALRTSALQEANLKLTEEMRHREHAQRELNKQTDLLVRSLTERARKSTLLAKMGELLQSCTHTGEAFPVVASFAPKLFPDIHGALLLVNPVHKLLEVAVKWSNCQMNDSVFEVNS